MKSLNAIGFDMETHPLVKLSRLLDVINLIEHDIVGKPHQMKAVDMTSNTLITFHRPSPRDGGAAVSRASYSDDTTELSYCHHLPPVLDRMIPSRSDRF